MAIADSKKVQTAINRVGQAIEKCRAEVAKMEAIKALYVAASPDPIGTPLEGNVTAMSNAITSLRTEVDKPIWDALIAAILPSHRGEAL